MNRRKFIGSSFLAALGLASAKRTLALGRDDPVIATTSRISADGIDPYFLESADLSTPEQEEIQDFLKYQENLLDGKPAIMPRGGKPQRAPTYRLLHWQGDLGDSRGRLVGPLSISPTLSGRGPFRFNGQILGFNVCTQDFSGGKGNGALSIELRARYQGEPMTWMYMEQFEATKGGGNSLGLGYVAQRNGMPEAVICEEPRVDIRVQLLKQKGGPGLLGKVLKVGSFLTGLPIGGGSDGSPAFGLSTPVLRVPQMVHEGVAFAQGTIASTSEEAPLWRSGFMSLALAKGAGRIAVKPGLWVAIDDSQDVDYSRMKLDDIGGRIGVKLDGEFVDLNYLVLDLEIESAERAGNRGEVRKKGSG